MIDIDAVERLIGSLTAELRLLRERRDRVLALCDKVDVRYVNRHLRVEDIRAIFSDTRTPDRQTEGN
jgi:hypothetical protein